MALKAENQKSKASSAVTTFTLAVRQGRKWLLIVWAFDLEAMLAPIHAHSCERHSASFITFVSHRSGGNRLYKMNCDGTNVISIFGGETILNGKKVALEPHWTRQSPNGRYFASWVYEATTARCTGYRQPILLVGRFDKTWTRIIYHDCDEEFAWSPDSARIAVSVASGKERRHGNLGVDRASTKIVICGIDGSQRAFVLEQPGVWAVLDWSPDGTRLLVSRRRYRKEKVSRVLEFKLANALKSHVCENGIGTLIQRTKQSLTLTADFFVPQLDELKEMNVSHARYSPNGRYLAVIFADPANMYGPNECANDELGRLRMRRYLGKLAIFDFATGRLTKIADYADGLRGPICWSPNGDAILFSRYLPKDDIRERMNDEHGLAIWKVSVSCKTARFITTGWSPDCRK